MRGVHNSFVVVKRRIKFFSAFGDFFFACPKKKEKRALFNRQRGFCTAQIVYGGSTNAGGLQILGVHWSGCESDLRAVRDGFVLYMYINNIIKDNVHA